MTIAAVRRNLARRFADAGIESPELDARLLVGAALGLDLTALVRAATQSIAPDAMARIESFATRRIDGEPVARILGMKEFWSLPLRLSPATLVPRPDTEIVVEAALDALAMRGAQGNPLRIADLGTGTGAILLALLSELPQATGVGTDLSEEALQTASGNAQRLGLAERARFVSGSYAETLTDSFDLIVSNPPYIRSIDIETLAREVRDHDPWLALDGGADGLAAYRVIAAQTPPRLTAGGVVVVEIGAGQRADVTALFAAAGLAVDGRAWPDLAGVPRAIVARNSDG